MRDTCPCVPRQQLLDLARQLAQEAVNQDIMERVFGPSALAVELLGQPKAPVTARGLLKAAPVREPVLQSPPQYEALLARESS